MTLRQGKERRDVLVHEEHEAALLAWHARAVSETPRFVMIVVFMPLLLLPVLGLAALLGSRDSMILVVGLALLALSLLMWRYPYATPQTVQLFGVQGSMTVVRIATALVALLGIVVAAAGVAILRA